MDTTKVKAAITAARTAINGVIDEEIKAKSFKGLPGLARVDTLLTRAEDRLTTVGQPKKSRKKSGK